jgi:DnaJ-class molecular chaperone
MRDATPLPQSLPDAPTERPPKTAECPVCQGDCVLVSSDGTEVSECEQCDGLGRVSQAVADEWREAHRPA